jgi:hypothetical protein
MVLGETRSGKSRLSFLLKTFLRQNGFEVEFECGPDFENENMFDEHMSKNSDQVLEYIKNSRTIVLKEGQVNVISEKLK